jgi:hypothetical protein
MVKILVISSCPGTKLNQVLKVSMETHMAYPAFLKKLVDAGANYVKYTIYDVEESKLKEGLDFVARRYHKIASQVEDFEFETQVLMDDVDMAKMLK